MALSSAQIRERDLWRCARCGKAWPEHVHHRVLRSQGGKDTFSNLVTLCTACHDWCHHHPADAARDGWIVMGGATPEQVPVAHVSWPGQPVWLRDDGSVGFAP